MFQEILTFHVKVATEFNKILYYFYGSIKSCYLHNMTIDEQLVSNLAARGSSQNP